MTNEELLREWRRKLPGVEPTDRELSAFALGVESGAALAAPQAEPKDDRTELGRKRSALLGDNVAILVKGGVPFLRALDATLRAYDHPAAPQPQAEPVTDAIKNGYRGSAVFSTDSGGKLVVYFDTPEQADAAHAALVAVLDAPGARE